ncbi:MAG: hypothetical protein OXB86_04190 [Bdellovibrionales bacterium]|nr:hypothetical protein [Bdellovibrionales bacterium]
MFRGYRPAKKTETSSRTVLMIARRKLLIIVIACLTGSPLVVYGEKKQELNFPPPVEENRDSIVRLFAFHSDGLHLRYGTGFFVENDRLDHVTVTTTFHFFLTPYLTGQPVKFMMEYQGELIALEDWEASFSPVQDIAFIHIPRSQLKDGLFVKSLKIRKTPLQREELLYAIGFPSGHFDTVEATNIQPHPEDQGDLTFILNKGKMSGFSGAPFMDQTGKLAVFYKKHYLNTGFGSGVEKLDQLMKDSNSCTGGLNFFEECVFEAGRELYRAGKAGNPKAQNLILQMGSDCSGCFENFMQSVGVQDLSVMKEEWKVFEEETAKAYIDVLYTRIIKNKDPQEMEMFWRKGRMLGEKGYPYIQHNLCRASLRLETGEASLTIKELLKCFQEPAQGGFFPSQWSMGYLLMSSDRIAALDWFKKSAEGRYLKSCRSMTEFYERRDELCSNQIERDKVVRVHNIVKRPCQDARLKNIIPYIPKTKKQAEKQGFVMPSFTSYFNLDEKAEEKSATSGSIQIGF